MPSGKTMLEMALATIAVIVVVRSVIYPNFSTIGYYIGPATAGGASVGL